MSNYFDEYDRKIFDAMKNKVLQLLLDHYIFWEII